MNKILITGVAILLGFLTKDFKEKILKLLV